VGASKRLNILVEGESVFNDAAAIVRFQIILAVIATGILDGETTANGVVEFFVVFFGGLVVGLGFGWLPVRAIIRRRRDRRSPGSRSRAPAWPTTGRRGAGVAPSRSAP
jgi:CPA1 family monovalent cation:H+ antiporter